MTFGRTVLAYLTGWLIVQPIYNRLLNAWRKRELTNPGSQTRAYWRGQAKAIVDEIGERRTTDRKLLEDALRDRDWMRVMDVVERLDGDWRVGEGVRRLTGRALAILPWVVFGAWIVKEVARGVQLERRRQQAIRRRRAMRVPPAHPGWYE